MGAAVRARPHGTVARLVCTGALLAAGTVVLLSSPRILTQHAEGPNVEARQASHLFPRLAIQLQLCCPNEATPLFADLGWWDLAVVDSETVGTMGDALGPKGRIRRANPNAIQLGYFSAGDVNDAMEMPIYRRFRSTLDERWLLRDAEGRIIPLFQFPNGQWTRALNPSTAVQRRLPEFIAQHVLGGGLLDGIFYDWATVEMSWLNRRGNVSVGRADADGDGIGDSDEALDRVWRTGYAAMLAYSRTVFPSSAVIVGNGGWNTGPDYEPYLNGVMIEQFLEGASVAPKYAWTAVMRTYAGYASNAVAPRVSIIMANHDDPGATYLMRFALASTLMFDGYFAFTNRERPTPAYQTARWYDEFSVDVSTGAARRDMRLKGYLGRPLSPAVSATSGASLGDTLAKGQPADADVWQRDFEHGRVLVNPTGATRRVDLGETFRRIRGTVDRSVNDGTRTRAVILGPLTGLILLRGASGGEHLPGHRN